MTNQLLTVIGTLGGAFIGILGTIFVTALSNRHALTLENLKNEHEKTQASAQVAQEKREQRTKVVEEVYSAILASIDEYDKVMNYVYHDENSELDLIAKFQEARSKRYKQVALINLYLPSLKSDMTHLTVSHSTLWQCLTNFWIAKRRSHQIDEPLHHDLEMAQKAYFGQLLHFQESLEKLIQ